MLVNLRLRRLCSCDTDFESRTREMKGFFLKQGYDHGCVSRGLERARGVSRADALSRRRRDTQSHRPVLALRRNGSVRGFFILHVGLIPFTYSFLNYSTLKSCKEKGGSPV